MTRRCHTIWRAISSVRIHHKSKATFDKNQKVQPRTKERLCSRKLQRSAQIQFNQKVLTQSKCKAINSQKVRPLSLCVVTANDAYKGEQACAPLLNLGGLKKGLAQ